MQRLSAFFVAACMASISISFGAVLYLSLGLPMAGAVVGAVLALTGFAGCSVAAARWSGPAVASAPVAELSRGVVDLAREVAELAQRLAAVEDKAGYAIQRAETATAPLAAELAEVGLLIKDLAESVSAHDLALNGVLAGPDVPASRVAAVAALADAPPPASAAPAALTPWPVPMNGSGEAPGAVPEMEPETVDTVEEPARASAFSSLSPEQKVEFVHTGLDDGRLEFHLQPIVTLPQRKAKYYEALARLRGPGGELLAARDFLAAAESGQLMPRLDNLMLLRCVQVVKRLTSKNREIGLFCNIAGSTIADAEFFGQFTDFMETHRSVAAALVLEFTQAALRSFGPIENEALGALANWGFRFSLDHVSDLRLEPRDLAERGFRFLKVPASLLLNRQGRGAGDIHAADLAGLLGRFGIELVAERIENEGTVLDLLDYDVKYGQGFVFSPPRPVRGEILQPPEPTEDAEVAAKRSDLRWSRKEERAVSVSSVNPSGGVRDRAEPRKASSLSASI